MDSGNQQGEEKVRHKDGASWEQAQLRACTCSGRLGTATERARLPLGNVEMRGSEQEQSGVHLFVGEQAAANQGEAAQEGGVGGGATRPRWEG